MEYEDKLSVDEASRTIKEAAASNRVEFEVPRELVDELLKSWRSADPTSPAEIRFMVEGHELGNFKIAACAYWSDTCCA